MIHTVKPGDTIYKIAAEYGTTPSKIISDNDLKDPARLVVGEDLVILIPSVTYTVEEGDTLEDIARNYGTTKEVLFQRNPILMGKDAIYPGQTLVISYTPSPALGEISMNGYAYPFIDESVLRRTLPYLTYLSVFTYGIRRDGTLVAPEGEEKLIRIAKEYRVVPLMMLTSLTESGNFSNELAETIIRTPALREKVISEAYNTMVQKGYGGIDVDFEFISASLADDYVSFLNELNSRMGDEYILFASLAPKSEKNMPGLIYEGHDYENIGAASDAVLLMTYEWGYTYGPPMAVSPIDKVRDVVEFGVSQIPSEKIYMGMPNYGYNWPLPFVSGRTAATPLSNVQAVSLALEKNAEIRFDETAMSPFFTYFDETGNGAVEHEVWFQNGRSAEAMFRLAAEFDLRGVAVWNIMKYFPALWLVLISLYNIRKEL